MLEKDMTSCHISSTRSRCQALWKSTANIIDCLHTSWFLQENAKERARERERERERWQTGRHRRKGRQTDRQNRQTEAVPIRTPEAAKKTCAEGTPGRERITVDECGTHSDLLDLIFGKFDVIFNMLT